MNIQKILPKFIVSLFTLLLLLIGSSSISAFINAVANPGRGHGRPEEVILGGLLFTIAMICVIGLCKTFIRNKK